jgi:hypothetical protein
VSWKKALKLQARSLPDALAEASELAVAENASKHHN